MKKVLFISSVLLFFSFLLSSCNTEKQVIRDLNKLDIELQQHGASYSTKDWKHFGKQYRKVLKKQQKCIFTNKELAEVTALNTRIAKNAVVSGSKRGLGRLSSVLSGLLRGLDANKLDSKELKELLRMLEWFEDE